MGSIDTTLSVKLDALGGRRFPDVSTETLVEAVWAITHFVYTGDNEVNFTRYILNSLGDSGHVAKQQPLSSIRRYQVDEHATPLEIAKLGCEVVSATRPQELEIDTSAPVFTQLIRQTALLVTQDGERYELPHELVKDKLVSKCSASIHVKLDSPHSNN
jgi:hypothetical protein